MVQIRGLLPRGQLVLNVAAQSVQENALQSLLIPPALSREGPELDRKGGDTSGTLAEMQETLGGLPAPDRVVKDLSHLLGEGSRSRQNFFLLQLMIGPPIGVGPRASAQASPCIKAALRTTYRP